MIINYYETYIEPILNKLPREARNSVLNNFTVQEHLHELNKKTILKRKHQQNRTIVSNIYWHISKLYTNTEFMDSFNNFGNSSFVPDLPNMDYVNAYKNIDSKTGKLTIPKRFHSIYEIKLSETKGYLCRIRGINEHSTFNVIPKHGERDKVYKAIRQVSQIPLLPIDDMFNIFKYLTEHAQIKYIVSTQKKAYHGNQYDIYEINQAHNKRNKILQLQMQIHDLITERDARLSDITEQLKIAQKNQENSIKGVQELRDKNADLKNAQNATSNILEAVKQYEELTAKKQQIEQKYAKQIDFAKQMSGLPFNKLRKQQAEKQK